eukprot:TRINITY_DN3175_c0_g1_i2.p1 TRINITY_DN3175_c0_g1~~TRINITY_DN3175_c0_g1_i2.p1  ORF type:complete len:207 (-),score=50.12 TRINITY_DN3175_c0_g1_i2:683-1303(-)
MESSLSFPNGSQVLLLHISQSSNTQEIQQLKKTLEANVGQTGKVFELLELKEVLPFDLSQLDGLVSTSLDKSQQEKLLIEYLRVLKPGANAFLYVPLKQEDKDEFSSTLLLKGFTSINVSFLPSSDSVQLAKVTFPNLNGKLEPRLRYHLAHSTQTNLRIRQTKFGRLMKMMIFNFLRQNLPRLQTKKQFGRFQPMMTKMLFKMKS